MIIDLLSDYSLNDNTSPIPQQPITFPYYIFSLIAASHYPLNVREGRLAYL